MMFPALRTMNSSPGSVWVIRFGLSRLSEHATNKKCPPAAAWPSASRSYQSPPRAENVRLEEVQRMPWTVEFLHVFLRLERLPGTA